MAADQLQGMGAITPAEWITLAVIALLLALWIFGSAFGVHSTTAALVGLSVLLLSGVLSWQDVLRETGAWDTIIWFAALVMMATQLNNLGFIPWFGEAVGALCGAGHWREIGGLAARFAERDVG